APVPRGTPQQQQQQNNARLRQQQLQQYQQQQSKQDRQTMSDESDDEPDFEQDNFDESFENLASSFANRGPTSNVGVPAVSSSSSSSSSSSAAAAVALATAVGQLSSTSAVPVSSSSAPLSTATVATAVTAAPSASSTTSAIPAVRPHLDGPFAHDPSLYVNYMHPSSVEFPNGDIEYALPVDATDSALESRSVGWAMVVYGHSDNKNRDPQLRRQTYNKSCLGVYQCPMCGELERPRVPRAGKKVKYSLPMQPRGVCREDGFELEHIPCRATMKVIHEADRVRFIHSGVHAHPLPRSVRKKVAKSRTSLQEMQE
ncbi:hypothetical protein BGZ54_004381, partial [Gamsiella multidivaricata]